MTSTKASEIILNVAPGSVVRVRDEDWLVTSIAATASGTLIKVQGLSELVRDTEAAFYSDLDHIEPVDPHPGRGGGGRDMPAGAAAALQPVLIDQQPDRRQVEDLPGFLPGDRGRSQRFPTTGALGRLVSEVSLV